MMSDLNFCLIQTELFWEDPEANLSMFQKKIDALDAQGQIIVLPEMFTTGFSMNPEELAQSMDKSAVEWMKKTAMKKKCVITGSLMIKETVEDKTHYYNRLIWMQPNGVFGFYDKRHLFSLAGENKYYTGGEKRIIFSVNGWKILPMICYDLRFPVWSRQQFTASGVPEYDVLLYVANWPEKRIHAWRSLLTARAIENQCYVVAVNRTGTDGKGIMHNGQSMVIDPLGQILFDGKDSESITSVKLDRSTLISVRESFPFLQDADDFQLMH
jgi:omega-amidase